MKAPCCASWTPKDSFGEQLLVGQGMYFKVKLGLGLQTTPLSGQNDRTVFTPTSLWMHLTFELGFYVLRLVSISLFIYYNRSVRNHKASICRNLTPKTMPKCSVCWLQSDANTLPMPQNHDIVNASYISVQSLVTRPQNWEIKTYSISSL